MSRLGRLWRAARRRALAPRFGAIVGIDTQLPLVALTFDDGPNPLVTRELLGVLARHGAQATHFLVGEAVLARPDLLTAIVEAGNAVGSHTHSHVSLVRQSQERRQAELAAGEAALGEHASGLFRPPYGHYDLAAARDVRAASLTCVYWNAHAEDWAYQDSASLAAKLRKAIAPGAIILLHEALYTFADSAAEDRTPLLEALDTVLGEFSSTYRFGTVPELLAAGRPVRRLIERRGEDVDHDALQRGSVQSQLGL